MILFLERGRLSRPPFVAMPLTFDWLPDLSTLRTPPHLPHVANPNVLTMGMSPMTGDWLEPAEEPVKIRAHKLERRAALGDAVYRVCPEGRAGAEELARRVFDYLALDTQELGPASDPGELLWLSSLAVHEDLVVMAPGEEGYSLVAASLCSPSHWRLPEKIGRPMARVHDPIPRIHQELTPRIDRIFDNLRVDTPVERYNWSVQADNALFAWPTTHDGALDPATPLWYRVERQTLTRLPNSQALAFTIRVHMDPLASLLRVDGALAALLAAIDSTPDDLKQYKTFDWLSPALDKYRTVADGIGDLV